MFILKLFKLLTDSRTGRRHAKLDIRDTKYRQKWQKHRRKCQRAATKRDSLRRRRTDTESRAMQRNTGKHTHRIYPINLCADFAEIQDGRIKLIRISSFIFHCSKLKEHQRTHMTISCTTYIMKFIPFSLFLQYRCSIIRFM